MLTEQKMKKQNASYITKITIVPLVWSKIKKNANYLIKNVKSMLNEQK